jgi:hypothetical protein
VRRIAALVVSLLAVGACGSERSDPLDLFAASSCAAIQNWIDAVEDETTALSRAVTPLENASDRVEHYRLFATAIDLRTWDTVRQLKRIAPTVGDGKIAADTMVAAMERSRGVTQELIELAESYPDSDDDPEPLASRISALFVRLEKAFAHPNQARDELGARYDAFVDIPACIDYVDPVS